MDHKTEEFFKLNPSRKIPVLEDGDFVLAESLAICQYLIEKNGSEKVLLGKTLKDRAVVTHRLCFNLGTVFIKLYDLTVSENFQIDYKQKVIREHLTLATLI